MQDLKKALHNRPENDAENKTIEEFNKLLNGLEQQSDYKVLPVNQLKIHFKNQLLSIILPYSFGIIYINPKVQKHLLPIVTSSNSTFALSTVMIDT